MDELLFNSYPQISQWAGKQNGVHLLLDDRELPYIEKDGLFWYFAQDAQFAHPAYRLVMTSTKDIGAEQ